MNNQPTITDLFELSKALNERCETLAEMAARQAAKDKESTAIMNKALADLKKARAEQAEARAEQAAREEAEDRLRVLRARARQARTARAWRNSATPLLALVQTDGGLFPRARSEAALFLVEGRR